MGLAVVVKGASFGEGLFPGLAGVEGQVAVAVLVVTLEHSVMGGQLVVDELDGVTGLDRHGGGLEGQHAGVGAELDFNGGSLGSTDVQADQHQEGAAGSCKGAKDGPHE